MTDPPAYAPDALELHDFLGGRVQVWQPRKGFRSGVDAVFLAAAAPARPGETVLDLGCGAGVAAFCLAGRVPGLSLHGLEVQEAYAALAERNAGGGGITVHRGTVSDPPAGLRALSFDGVIANPPYHREGSVPEAGAKQIAHLETAPLADWIDCAIRRLKPGGWLTVIQRAERLRDMLAAMDGRVGGIRVKPLAGRIGRPASRVIVKARKGSHAPLTLFAPLIEHAGAAHLRDGEDYSDDATAILRHGRALEF